MSGRTGSLAASWRRKYVYRASGIEGRRFILAISGRIVAGRNIARDFIVKMIGEFFYDVVMRNQRCYDATILS